MGDIRSRRPEQIPLKDCSTVTAPLIYPLPLAVTQPRVPEKGQVASTLADHHSLPVFAVAACRPAMPKQVCCVDLYDCSAVTLALPDNALVFPLVEGVESRQSAELLIGDILLHGGGQLQGIGRWGLFSTILTLLKRTMSSREEEGLTRPALFCGARGRWREAAELRR